MEVGGFFFNTNRSLICCSFRLVIISVICTKTHKEADAKSEDDKGYYAFHFVIIISGFIITKLINGVLY